MPQEPIILPNRRSIRLPGFDYTQAGAYFITINTFKRERLFGIIVQQTVILSPLGEIVKQEWLKLEKRFDNILLDEFNILPDHFHGTIISQRFDVPETELHESFSHPIKGSLSTIIRSFKASVTVRGRHLLNRDLAIWQKNYYEEFIEDDEKLEKIREYIHYNACK